MARNPRLKVYRTAIGFHDAYVAAPSQKVALVAWGADKNLFAMGAAETVTDPALTAEPLAAPGSVVRKTRGSLAQHLAVSPQKPGKQAPPRGRSAAPKPPPAPRPSRDELDRAQDDLRDFAAQADAAMADLRERERALARERESLQRAHEKNARQLEKQVETASERYERAMNRWRSDL